MYFWREILEGYEVAYIDRETNRVRFENSKGWFEEITLTEEIAFIIITEGMRVVYE